MVQSSSTRKRERKDGSISESVRHYYKCYGKSRFKECDGLTTYTVGTIDDCVDEVVRGLLEQVKSIPSSVVLKELASQQQQSTKRQCEAAKSAVLKKEQDLSKLEGELVLVLTGNSVFDKETLGRVIKSAQQELDALKEQYENLCQQLEQEEKHKKGIKDDYKQMITWADLYDSASHNEKKVILAHLIKRVEVWGRDDIKIELNVSYQDLLHGLADTKKEALKLA